MGMLMHHTWLAQQEARKPAEKPVVETKETKPVEKEEEPVRKPGRRKVTK